MRAMLQRVTEASVTVDGVITGAIDHGLLVLLGVDKDDNQQAACKLVDKLLAYRVFADDEGKMNRSVSDIQGDVLIVSQFTLSADTRKGLRPSFSSAAAPALASELYDYVVEYARSKHDSVTTGVFGANMQVQLTNDGPVTFLLES
ncbi:MAG: D-aminoacyl-tRNA deacylase [Pseudomonadales bacterium]